MSATRIPASFISSSSTSDRPGPSLTFSNLVPAGTPSFAQGEEGISRRTDFDQDRATCAGEEFLDHFGPGLAGADLTRLCRAAGRPDAIASLTGLSLG